MLRRTRGFSALLLLAVPLLGACGDDEPAIDTGGTTTAAEPAANTVAITAAENTSADGKTKTYSFSGPAEFKGGVVTIEFKNTGKEDHVFFLNRLEDGKTFADVTKELAKEEQGPPPPWAKAEGAAVATGGTTAEYTVDLPAGSYAAFCPVPGMDGKPHFASGMAAPYTVTAGESGDLPEADVTVTAKDFSWEGLQGLKSGEQTVRFDNTGPENHELVLFELQPGKTAADAKKFLSSDGPPSGPPPWSALPGVSGELVKDKSAVASLTLKPATTYAAVCFVGNQKGPHFLQGMLLEVKIS